MSFYSVKSVDNISICFPFSLLTVLQSNTPLLKDQYLKKWMKRNHQTTLKRKHTIGLAEYSSFHAYYVASKKLRFIGFPRVISTCGKTLNWHTGRGNKKPNPKPNNRNI